MAPDDQLDRLRDRIVTNTDISDPDREVLQEFDDALTLLSSEYSTHRHLKLLRHCTIVAESVGGLAAALKDREAAETIVRWIHREYDNEETNRDYRVALRVFGRRVSDGEDDEPPDSLAWIPSGTSLTYDPTPDPSQMLERGTDVQAMLEATRNSRDAAAIAMQFDAGLRGSEFEDLTVGDVTDHEHGLQVTVEGKQGRRSVTLIPSVPYVQRWLADHPRPDDPEAPLWCTLESGEEMSYQSICNMFRRPAERAGVTKPVTLTAFRKSSASYLASKGLSQAHIEDHHGWVRGSDAAARYVAVFADEADRELARLHGREVEAEDDDELAPRVCQRCGRETPREKDLCVWCGQALEPEAAARVDAVDELLVDILADADTSETAALLDIRERLRDDPELRADVIKEFGTLVE